MVDVAILAGGVGTRLWPASDGNHPKQFLTLPHDKTLLEQAVERAKALTTIDKIWIVTLSSQVFGTRKVLGDFPPEQILAEPMGKNSGPAAASATMFIEAKVGRPTTVLILTADHYIPDLKSFVNCAKKGVDRASKGESLVTFGLMVKEPRTDYGYIEAETTKLKNGVLKVRRFIEKPSFAKAKVFSKQKKKYFWNSGMFAWRSDFFKKEFSEQAPKIYPYLASVEWGSPLLPDQLLHIYELLPNISIDYALMEKSKNIDVVPSTFSWSDLGNWDAVYEATKKDKGKNSILGEGVVVDGKGNLVYSQHKRVVLFGVNNLVVVESESETLVTTREQSKGLKKLLKEM